VGKKKKFYKYTEGVSSISQNGNPTFLLRFHDEGSNSIQNAGSFNEEEKAIEELNKYLKEGICSWIVSYNG